MIQVHERKITCDSCNYIWDSKSDLIYVTCPSCMHKVKTKKVR